MGQLESFIPGLPLGFLDFSKPPKERQGAQPQTALVNLAQRQQIETDWQTWLKTCGPRTFTGSFAPFHADFWEWNWALTQKLRNNEPITEDELVFLALWFRGAGKSSHVEWAAIAEGALVGSGYVLYVSGTQTLAEGHVSSIKERLESEEVSRYYPSLANPQIGRHGNQYGWRQDFLRTSSGWAIRPIGLDVGVRGGRVGDKRPTLVIFDDVDNHSDSPLVVQNKLETIARSIIPAGTARTRKFFAQNLIHRNSVANQIYTRKTDVLKRRICKPPIPAFAGLQVETRQTERGPQEVITAGSPTWPDIDLKACETFLNDSGRAAFLAEYQHDFSASEQGRVIPEYDESIHVITWSDFKLIFGLPYIPEHWEREVGHDVGFTEAHQSAWTWIATSAMNSALPRMRFRYRGLTFTGVGVDEQAEEVKRLMAPDFQLGRLFDEMSLIRSWRMSHEALSERMTYRSKHGLLFVACDSAKTAGIHQWRHYLRVDRTKPHPFKEDDRSTDGKYRLGCPAWFDIVDDDQLVTPRDDKGLVTHRRETIEWRYRPDILGVAGLSKPEPMKKDENTADSCRMITSTWGPDAAPLREHEQTELSLPAGLRRTELDKRPLDVSRDFAELVRDSKLSRLKEQKRQTGENWTSQVMDTNDDPWLDTYKETDWQR